MSTKSPRIKPSDMDPSLTGTLASEIGTHTELGAFLTPCQATGRSGVRHNFTFGFGESQSLNVVGDVVQDVVPIDETKVLSLFIKVYDVGAKHAVLCVVPSLTTEAKKLSGLYKIVTVEAGDRVKLARLASETLNRIS